MEQKEKIERIKDFRLIDDVFFEVFAEDIPACQEILRTILEDSELIVNEVIVQSSERNLYGRSVRLDVLCTLGDGSLVNIEIQRSDNDNHLKRTRFNAASITVKESEPGIDFEEVKDVYIVYISEKDFFGVGLTTYHIDKVIRENGIAVDDGLHEIFVNTAVDDGSSIAELMQCFTQKNLDNPNFKAVTRRFKELKETEGGLRAVCKIMEDIVKKEVAEAVKEAETARKEAETARKKAEEEAETARKEAETARKKAEEKNFTCLTNMIMLGISKGKLLELGFNEDEYREAYKEAEKALIAKV